MEGKTHESPTLSQGESSRRDFLKSATTVAAGLMAPKAMQAEPHDLLPTIMLGPHRVTRMIVGSNPIYGYSHVNKQYDQHMREWFTDERIVKLLLDCEKAGINTWQYSFNFEEKRQIPKLRAAGCNLQFICLAASWHYDEKMARTPEADSGGHHQVRAGGDRVQAHWHCLPRRRHRHPLPGGEDRPAQNLYRQGPRHGNPGGNLHPQSQNPETRCMRRVRQRLLHDGVALSHSAPRGLDERNWHASPG